MSATDIALLKKFVELCKFNPDMLHQPEMAFYKEYLERLIIFHQNMWLYYGWPKFADCSLKKIFKFFFIKLWLLVVSLSLA